ncbi:MAG: hypothetical protein JSR73_14040 [Proteobacteria bacterium]|nr:hypothetical protein [Pseudomonadota bacterium]
MLARSMLGLAAAGCLAAATAAAADNTAVGQDLKATIALNGFPCDQVVDSKRNADSDYTATCKDGHRYRVYVDASGRVVVQRL